MVETDVIVTPEQRERVTKSSRSKTPIKRTEDEAEHEENAEAPSAGQQNPVLRTVELLETEETPRISTVARHSVNDEETKCDDYCPSSPLLSDMQLEEAVARHQQQ
ncbi:hypothetical protein PI125_g19744 [Phytophthora idaei]|nr:hypothetical protein PI125_g19744 [Phytophthora idaei]KAG3148230.1 hypothetical protein PI126_g12520 [Phytophthora idaei]